MAYLPLPLGPQTAANSIPTNNATDRVGFANVASSTPKQVSVTTASTQLLAANSSRVYAHIINNSTSVVYIQYSASAVVGQGIKLNIGAIWTVDAHALWQGAINAITSSGSVNIDVFEGIY